VGLKEAVRWHNRMKQTLDVLHHLEAMNVEVFVSPAADKVVPMSGTFHDRGTDSATKHFLAINKVMKPLVDELQLLTHTEEGREILLEAKRLFDNEDS
jgi:hypothetical protein